MTYSDYMALAAVALAAYYNWQYRRVSRQLAMHALVSRIMEGVLEANVPFPTWKQWVAKYTLAHQGELNEKQT